MPLRRNLHFFITYHDLKTVVTLEKTVYQLPLNAFFGLVRGVIFQHDTAYSIQSCYKQFIIIFLCRIIESSPCLCLIFYSHVGIKQVQFGGSEFVNWNEDLKTEEVGYSVRKI